MNIHVFSGLTCQDDINQTQLGLTYQMTLSSINYQALKCQDDIIKHNETYIAR